MCAINGCTGSSEERVRRMNAATVHRGPDATRVITDGAVTLGFNRLAIIDLSERGMQPMTDRTGRYHIVFNGELYNFKELKSELSSYPFQSESDTEVVLAAYAEWGEAALKRFNGIFAFAVWDATEQSLLLVRDPGGVKQLYWTIENGDLLFSSELRGVLAAGIRPKISIPALQKYLTLQYVPGSDTLITGVHLLPPGGILKWQQGSTVTSSYAIPKTTSTYSYDEAVPAVHDALMSAVARQLVSDRPVGVFLSGGIDSSIILAAASKVHPHINTYTMGYALDEREDPAKFNADARLARTTAAHFSAEHHEYMLEPKDALQLLEESVRFLSDPVGNATALSQLYLARETKPTATVVLSGEGGDELFGGYERYRLALKAQQYTQWMPQWTRDTLSPFSKVFLSGVDRYAQLMFQDGMQYVTSEIQDRDSVRSFFAPEFTMRDDVAALMRADERHWLVGEALRRADLMGMAASIEVRVPFLDAEVVSLAHSLPRSYKVTTAATKRVLKDAFRDLLPHELLYEPKRGWFSPGAKWLRRQEFVSLADTVFATDYTPVASLFDIPHLRHAWEAHREHRAYHYTSLWSILTLLMWAREYHVTL